MLVEGVGAGEELVGAVSLTIDTENPLVATAAAAIRDAFDAAVPAIAGMTHGLVLQEA